MNEEEKIKAANKIMEELDSTPMPDLQTPSSLQLYKAPDPSPQLTPAVGEPSKVNMGTQDPPLPQTPSPPKLTLEMLGGALLELSKKVDMLTTKPVEFAKPESDYERGMVAAAKFLEVAQKQQMIGIQQQQVAQQAVANQLTMLEKTLGLREEVEYIEPEPQSSTDKLLETFLAFQGMQAMKQNQAPQTPSKTERKVIF